MKKVDLKLGKRVEHPLAKYNSAGQLFCLLCNTPLKNQNLWTAHVNGRAHAENVQALKAKKRPQSSDNGEAPPAKKPAANSSPLKPALVTSYPEFKSPLPVKSTPHPQSQSTPSEPKHAPTNSAAARLRFIEENDTSESFKQNGGPSQSSAVYSQNSSSSSGVPATSEPEPGPSKPSTSNKGLGLPEGFFDDPKLDARARGLEWRDPEEIEWENFVKEIAGEDIKSSTIRVVDEEESTKVRELEEIEEQMAHWQKVIDLEKKAAEVREKQKLKEQSAMETEENDEDDDDYDEDMDWRSKRR